jgi:hypothetical protein
MEHRGQNTWAGSLGCHLKNLNGLSLLGLHRLASMSRFEVSEAHDLFMDLAREWGNIPFAAQPDFVSAAAQIVKQMDGPVLELGSGLTTLAMAAANPAVTIHSLEHDAIWAMKLAAEARRLGLANISLHFCELKEYDIGRWYDPPGLPWKDFQFVLCDGPPKFCSNRSVLFQVMEKEGCNPRCILVDDAHRDGCQMPPGYRSEVRGLMRKFAVGPR